MQPTMHVYEVRPRKDKRGVDLISEVLPFGRLWYGDANAVANAIGYAEHFSRSHDAVIRVYDTAGNMPPPILEQMRKRFWPTKAEREDYRKIKEDWFRRF